MNAVCREELRKYEEKYRVEHSTGDLAPTVCALFEAPDFPFPGFGGAAASDLGLDKSFKSALTPKESLEFLKETVRKASGVDVPDALWTKMLG